MRRLLLARLVSTFAVTATGIGISFEIFARTGSSLLLTLSLLAGFGSRVLAMPLISHVLQGRNPSRATALAEAFVAVVAVSMVVVPTIPVWIVGEALIGILAAAHAVGVGACLNEMADDSLGAARWATAGNVGIVVGGAIGGVITELAGAAGVLGLQAVAAAFASVMLISALRGAVVDIDDRPRISPYALLTERGPRTYAIGFTATLLFSSFTWASCTVWAAASGGAWVQGVLVAVWGMGNALGSSYEGRRPGRGLWRMMLIGALGYGALALGHVVALGITGYAIAGWATGVMFVRVLVRLTDHPDRARRTSRLAGYESLKNLCMGVGVVLGGAVLSLVGDRGSFLVVGVGIATIAAMLLVGAHAMDSGEMNVDERES